MSDAAKYLLDELTMEALILARTASSGRTAGLHSQVNGQDTTHLQDIQQRLDNIRAVLEIFEGDPVLPEGTEVFVYTRDIDRIEAKKEQLRLSIRRLV